MQQPTACQRCHIFFYFLKCQPILLDTLTTRVEAQESPLIQSSLIHETSHNYLKINRSGIRIILRHQPPIHACFYSLWNCQKCPHVRWEKNPRFAAFCTKTWAGTHPPSKFHGESLRWFLCNPADKLTSRQTNKQTGRHREKQNKTKHNLLGGDNKSPLQFSPMTVSLLSY